MMESLTAAELVEHLRAEVPEAGALVDDHVAEHEEVLLHLLIADVRRLLWQRFCDGDTDVVRRGLTVLDRGLAAGDAAVVNAVAVSFVEDLGIDDPDVQPFVALWPPALQEEVERQRAWEPDPYYVFVWDREAEQVVASFVVARPGARMAGVPDVTGGVIPAEEEEAHLARLREQYPIERYTFGGGYSPTLAACVHTFFALEKDADR